MKQTDWEKYYHSPLPTAFYSRAVIRKHLLGMLRKTGLKKDFSIAELGGGGSCFYNRINKKFSVAEYTVFDSCMTGIQAFIKKFPNGDAVQTDLLTYHPERQYDIVFSVGLIEHFPEEKTATMIRKHFEMTKPGGYVVIFFPTPTALYHVTRKLAELLGVWQFPDERPIEPEEFRKNADQFGMFLKGYTIRANFLSQYAALYRKNER